jgi:hypothetical protein
LFFTGILFHLLGHCIGNTPSQRVASGGLSAFLPDSKSNSSEELRRLTILNSANEEHLFCF